MHGVRRAWPAREGRACSTSFCASCSLFSSTGECEGPECAQRGGMRAELRAECAALEARVGECESDSRSAVLRGSESSLFVARWRLCHLVDAAHSLACRCATGAGPPAPAATDAAPRWHFWSQPDLCGLLAELTWHQETRPSVIPLVRLMSKLLPCRCLYRGFVKSLRSQCEADEATFGLCRHMLLTSLTGQITVEGVCCEQPRFEGLCRLDWWGRATPRAAMIEWMCEHPHVVFWAMKESLVAYVRANAPMREVVNVVYPGWSEYERDVVSVCDVLRASVGRRRCMREVDALFARQSSGARYVHKLLKTRYDSMIYAAAVRVLNARGVTQEEVLRQTESTRAEAARVCARAYGMSVVTLRACGVSARLAIAVVRCRVKYETGAQGAAETEAVLAEHDTGELCVFFAAMHARRLASALQFVPLPLDTYAGQMSALRERSATGALPPSAGVMYYCATCDDLKCFCVQDAAVNVFAVGVPRVMLHAQGGGVLFCNRKGDKGRKRKCGGARLMAVDLKGRAVCWRGRWYMLCPRCGAVCLFDLRRAVGVHGFSCGECAAHDAGVADEQRTQDAEPCLYCASPAARRGQTLAVLSEGSDEGYASVRLCSRHRVRRDFSRGAVTREALISEVNRMLLSRATQP